MPDYYKTIQGSASALRGPTGPPGTNGGAGSAGSKGVTGSTGATGHIGPTNALGATGPHGSIGPTGTSSSFWSGSVDISNVNTGNVGVFTKKDPSSAITGWDNKAMDISGNLRVRAVAETQGLMLTPIQSAEGGFLPPPTTTASTVSTSNSAIINLSPSNPSQNPLLTKGLYWINKTQDMSEWTDYSMVMPCWPSPAVDCPGKLPFKSLRGAALGGKIYIQGGILYDGLPFGPPPTPPTEDYTFNDASGIRVWGGYNSASSSPEPARSWTTLGTLPPGDPSGQAEHQVVACGGKIYMIGGIQVSSFSLTRPGWPAWSSGWQMIDASSCRAFDPSTNTISTLAPLRIPRRQFGATVIGNYIIVAGGITNVLGTDAFGPQVGDISTNTVEIYDPIDNSWNFLQSMNYARPYCRLETVGGNIYAIGGAVAYGAGIPSLWQGVRNTTVEMYNFVDNSWNFISPMPMTPGDVSTWGPTNHMTASLGGKIHVMGGFTGDWNFPSPASTRHMIYDPLSKAWSVEPVLDLPRQNAACVVMGGKIFLMGGTQWRGPTSTTDVVPKTATYYDPSLVQMPQITHQGEDFYVSAQRGGPKTFVIPHPEHKGKMLRHACVEAPTRGTNIYEYQIEVKEHNATTEIALPSYFSHINTRPRVYVRTENAFSTCYGKVNEELTRAIIRTEKPGIFNIMVTAIRKDPAAVKYASSIYIDDPIIPKDIPLA